MAISEILVARQAFVPQIPSSTSQELNHFTTATPYIYVHVHVYVKVGFWNKDHQTKAKLEVCFTDIYSKQSMASELINISNNNFDTEQTDKVMEGQSGE